MANVVLTRDYVRELSKMAFPSDKKQIELSDAVTSGLKLLWYSSGKMSYLASFMLNKQRIREILGPVNDIKLSEARAMIEQMRSDRLEFGVNRKAVRMTFNDLSVEYLKHSQAVKRSYRSDVGRYKHHLRLEIGNTYITKLDRISVELLYQKLQSNLSIPLANRVINLLKSMMSFAVKASYLKSSPLVGLKLTPEIKGEVSRLLTDEECKKVLHVLDGEINRDAANLIKFLMLTGMRLGEAMNLKAVDCLRSGVVKLTTTKAGGGRMVPVSKGAMNVIDLQISKHGMSGFVFRGKGGISQISAPRRFFQRVCEKAGVGRCRIHDLRHTVASMLVEVTDIYQVQEILGHKSISTSQHYAKNKTSALQQSLNKVCELYGETHEQTCLL